MRYRTTLGLAVALGVFAVMAASALAAPIFKASAVGKEYTPAEPGKTKGSGAEQAFQFGPFKIKCAQAKAKGIVTAHQFKDFATNVKFSKCLTEAKFGSFRGGLKTKFSPVKIVYHVNGFAEVGSEGPEGSEVKITGGEANIKISGKICNIIWPAQTVPAKAVKNPEGEFSAVTYTNESVPTENLKKFPSGFQKKLSIANELKGMTYEFEGGQCTGEGGFEEPAKKEEGKTAKYIGSLVEEVVSGNLEKGTTEEV
jgi:hypothetical protein